MDAHLAATGHLGGADQHDDQHHQRRRPHRRDRHSTPRSPRTRRSPPGYRSPRSTPARQVLDTETKLIHHAIRIAAFNTAQSLARAIVTATGYTRADDEAHTLIRTALAGSGDIIPDGDTLHIRLDPLPAPRHTAAIDELCHALNDTHTVYPGTDLTLRYSIKSHR